MQTTRAATGRWAALAILFAARATMGFQFQSVPAAGPSLLAAGALDLADLGLLTGIYFAPGMLVAWPGGALASRYGDRRMVMISLLAMAAGGAVMAALPESWGAQLSGRALAGVGGVIVNVVMSKMVADRFAPGELALAMGIFVNSWPVGIAIALLAAPPIVEAQGAAAVYWAASGLNLLGLAGVAALAETRRTAAGGGWGRAPAGRALAATVCGGAAWGFYNGALGMVFAFGPALMAERGFSPVAAGAATSAALWAVAVALPFGGWLATRPGLRGWVLYGGLALFGAALAAAAGRADSALAFAALGLAGAAPAGVVMGLAGPPLSAETRAAGMGIFFTVYYAPVLAAPWLGGVVAEARGGAGASFMLGAGLCALAIVAALASTALARRGATS